MRVHTFVRRVVLGALLLAPSAALAQPFLLIPDRATDTIGRYSPFDGSFLGPFATVPFFMGETASTPVNAAVGPDGLVYVTDQVQDRIFQYDIDGNYLGVFADRTDGLNNIRGLDFRGNNLYVASGDDYAAVFDLATGNRLANFFDDNEPFDIFFLNDGRALVSDILSTDEIYLYGADGSSSSLLFATDPTNAIPQQIQSLSNGNFMVALSIGDALVEFNLAGDILNQITLDGVRGAYELGNGNYLLSGGAGLHVVDPLTGDIVTTINANLDGEFIELVPEPTSFALLGIGAVGLLRRARTRRGRMA